MALAHPYTEKVSLSFRSHLKPARLSLAGTAFAVRNFIRPMAKAWHDYQSLRMLEAMPSGLLKDIGWPAPDTKR